MAVFRIEKTRDYTVMSNHHLRDMSLSLKAKGLLSLMLSLPENWDYTMKGLARICKDGIDSISGGIRELEEHGYLIRERVRGANGQLGSIEYTILEQPKEPTPAQEKPIRENPVQANPTLVTPVQEEPAQLNKEESSNYPSRTDLSSTELSNPTLLSAMENAGKDDIPDEAERKGLGTPATRAAIIEKLVAAGFVERKGKSLIPTKAGINLVTVLPEPLTSPMLTAEWEQKLTEIAKGGADPDTFMDGIRTMVQEIVSTYSCISEDGKKLFAPEKEVIGTCPRCGQPVYEGKKNFACSDRSCGFVLWKNDRFWTSRKKELTKKMAADLLKKGRTNVKGMWSEKKQAAYDAAVILDDTGGKYINFKLEFPKRKEGVNGRK